MKVQKIKSDEAFPIPRHFPVAVRHFPVPLKSSRACVKVRKESLDTDTH